MAFNCRQFLVFESVEWKGLLISQNIKSQHLLQYRRLEFDAQMGICLCLQGKICGCRRELKITSRYRKMIFDGDLVPKCPLWSFRRVYVSLQNFNFETHLPRWSNEEVELVTWTLFQERDRRAPWSRPRMSFFSFHRVGMQPQTHLLITKTRLPQTKSAEPCILDFLFP